MAVLDIEQLAQPISEAEPCGPDLQYDADFIAFETAAQGKPEQQYGSTVIPAEPPDWRDVQRSAKELLARTKDLRVACQLSRALLADRGLGPFCESLGLIRALTERYWDAIHPQLDPDDDNDPTQRVNVLMALVNSAMVAEVTNKPLASSPTSGQYTLRDLRIARGEIKLEPAEGETLPTLSAIEGVLSDTDLDRVKQLSESVSLGLADLQAVEEFVTNQVGSMRAPNFEDMVATLRPIAGFLRNHVISREGGQQPAPVEVADETAGEAPAGGGAPVVARAVVTVADAEIRTRQDVVKALDKIIEYYDRSEPSSPLPLLLTRARRLVTMNFLDILQDLAPDGLSQARLVSGVDE